MKRNEAIKLCGKELVEKCDNEEKFFTMEVSLFGNEAVEYRSACSDSNFFILAKYYMPIKTMESHPDKNTLTWKAYDYEIKKVSDGRMGKARKKITMSFAVADTLAEWLKMESELKSKPVSNIIEEAISEWAKKGH